MDILTSRDNPRFKRLLKLAGSARERRAAGVMFLEGMHLIQSWEAAGFGWSEPGTTVLVAEGAATRPEVAAWLNCHPEAGPVLLADRLFAALAEAETPQGILACVPQPGVAGGAELARDSVLLDGVQDPGNLGTLLRTAAASGFTQILLSSDCTSPWSGKALRAGQGAQFLLSIHEQQVLPDFLSRFSGQSLATSLQGQNSLYAAEVLQTQGPLAWVFGAEGQGISPEVLNATDLQLRIPMLENVESLNVAAAAAVCLFEVVRLRMNKHQAGNTGNRT